MTRAGKLRHRITFRRKVEQSRTAANEPVYGYVNVSPKAWASKRQPGGREYFADGIVQNEITTVFETRYRTDITENDRIAYKGVEYDIRHIGDPTGEERNTVFACVLRR